MFGLSLLSKRVDTIRDFHQRPEHDVRPVMVALIPQLAIAGMKPLALSVQIGDRVGSFRHARLPYAL
jgi:hypothetical protein